MVSGAFVSSTRKVMSIFGRGFETSASVFPPVGHPPSKPLPSFSLCTSLHRIIQQTTVVETYMSVPLLIILYVRVTNNDKNVTMMSEKIAMLQSLRTSPTLIIMHIDSQSSLQSLYCNHNENTEAIKARCVSIIGITTVRKDHFRPKFAGSIRPVEGVCYF